MKNNSNNKSLTAEDIEVKLHIVPMSTYDGDRDVGAYHLEIMEDWSESDANEIKQQILDNQEIVEKLKSQQSLYTSLVLQNKTTPKDGYNNDIHYFLNSILKNPENKK